ncbi:MAG TPA: undecaprenyl-diphosphate phosphatase [Acidimicrobiales bacterium]
MTSPSPARRRPRAVAAAVLLLALVAAWGMTTFGGGPAAAQGNDGSSGLVVVTSDQVTEAENAAADAEMNAWKAAVLGVVEGVTEYLPISSTGHLVVTQRILGIGDDDATKDAADSYAIAIQFGAILAVFILYWQRIVSLVQGLLGRDEEGRRLLIALVLAFLPAVVVGVALESTIKDHLFGTWPVIAAWTVGGLLILWVAPKIRPGRPGLGITDLTWRHGLIIGVAQVLAMWPGTSRSLVTILAALAVGASLAAAVEFSFLLGLATLSAATMYESAKSGSDVIDAYGWVDPLVGMVAAFIAAVVAIRWMVSWLQTRSLAVFGWERLAAAAITIVLLATSVI